MKQSKYTTHDEIPLFLNAGMVAKVLGISISSTYELMHEASFSALRVGSRIVVPKENSANGLRRKRAVRDDPRLTMAEACPCQELLPRAESHLSTWPVSR